VELTTDGLRDLDLERVSSIDIRPSSSSLFVSTDLCFFAIDAFGSCGLTFAVLDTDPLGLPFDFFDAPFSIIFGVISLDVSSSSSNSPAAIQHSSS
jgi:hypothetical protein